MRILYIDIDTLRPDHLGCYGYHRKTSPNIDALAGQAVQFNSVHASDVPCLPSRSALLTGRFGIHNGVVNHGGTDADPVLGGPDRQFWSQLQIDSFPSRLKRAGLKTVTVSSFAQRHSAFHWHAGFDEAYNVGKYGLETADEVHAVASDWLTREGSADNWFLHVHMWDPHTPYRAHESYGEPFAGDEIPSWLTDEIRQQHWLRGGPHSARECVGFAPRADWLKQFPRQPQEMNDMSAVRKMFDGYDTGVLMADDYVGRILNQLVEMGIEEETVIMLSSDHGETLGELNIYCDHHVADQMTTRIPFLLKWPGVTDELSGQQLDALHYQIDLSATVLDLLDVKVPSSWDGISIKSDLQKGNDLGRDCLVVSQGAWTCQRSVRWQDYICIQSLHDGYHLFDDVMLFDLANDPHETDNIAQSNTVARDEGLSLLGDWLGRMMQDAARGCDPLQNVINEGGPYHVKNQLKNYLSRLRDTDRHAFADALEQKFGSAS
tara:strand:- start:7410 stop:8882 length:1473 start_codon:yes stop_codon:yes gene_type:complete